MICFLLVVWLPAPTKTQYQARQRASYSFTELLLHYLTAAPNTYLHVGREPRIHLSFIHQVLDLHPLPAMSSLIPITIMIHNDNEILAIVVLMTSCCLLDPDEVHCDNNNNHNSNSNRIVIVLAALIT